MLILTRRVGETLKIGDDISVTVLGVKGNQVRIGVQAPDEVAVHREEIYDQMQPDHTDLPKPDAPQKPMVLVKKRRQIKCAPKATAQPSHRQAVKGTF